MTTTMGAPDEARAWAGLQYLCELLKVIVVAAILSGAMIMQYAYGELPCPLCLLQRVALFGVAFGAVLNLRRGFADRFTGISLLFATVLLIISVRQTLLDICPRPGHEYIGSAVFGLHMPVWSVLIALALIVAHIATLLLPGGRSPYLETPSMSFPGMASIAKMVAIYVAALCVINFVSVLVQCGLGECHTFGYRLLGTVGAQPGN
ncbi:MAG: disulfide bond formation protein B [Hyphomicrobiaceae bacterium]